MTEIREVKEIITYDWVTNGGVDVATKHTTPSLESALKARGLSGGRGLDINITPELLDNMARHDLERQAAASAAGLECDILMPVTRIRDASGWREVPTFDLSVGDNAFKKMVIENTTKLIALLVDKN